MEDTTKYLIHATIAADGVVERSDVVGAVFGQTEGLLGEELDLRDLQQSSKVGRIDVSIESENGQSFGEVTVASSLDKVETAILAAALETITRVGPCRASVEVTQIEDVRATKRREVVDRAKELLAGGFEETALSSDEVLEEVRDAARIEGIAEYKGLPAGPRVHDSDAVIVVEGRADVLTLLDAGIKNGIAVEGTNVPEAVANLTQDRTVTAFLDGDRGGELILRELSQVGDVDYVAFAPAGQSVEDLDRSAVLDALRGKVPSETLAEEPNVREVARDPPSGSPTTESSTPDGTTANTVSDTDDESAESDTTNESTETASADTIDESTETASADTIDESTETEASTTDDESTETEASTTDDESTETEASTTDDGSTETEASTTDDGSTETEASTTGDGAPDTKSARDHVSDIVTADSGRARLIDSTGELLAEIDAADAFDAVEDAESAPHTVVIDGEITQRLLDVAAQRGVSQIFGRSTGSVVKQPIGTRVTTVEETAIEAEA